MLAKLWCFAEADLLTRDELKSLQSHISSKHDDKDIEAIFVAFGVDGDPEVISLKCREVLLRQESGGSTLSQPTQHSIKSFRKSLVGDACQQGLLNNLEADTISKILDHDDPRLGVIFERYADTRDFEDMVRQLRAALGSQDVNDALRANHVPHKG